MGVVAVFESLDLGKVFFTPEFHLVDVIFCSSEVLNDPMVFLNKLINFDSGLIKLYEGLRLLS